MSSYARFWRVAFLLGALVCFFGALIRSRYDSPDPVTLALVGIGLVGAAGVLSLGHGTRE